MSYHRFPNFGGILQGDLVNKPRQDLAPKYFLDRELNCNSTTKVNRRCVYGGECRRCCVIYRVTYKCCGNFYVENIQNTPKKEWSNTSNMWIKNSQMIRIRNMLLLTSINILHKNQVHYNVAKVCLSIYLLR